MSKRVGTVVPSIYLRILKLITIDFELNYQLILADMAVELSGLLIHEKGFRSFISKYQSLLYKLISSQLLKVKRTFEINSTWRVPQLHYSIDGLKINFSLNLRNGITDHTQRKILLHHLLN